MEEQVLRRTCDYCETKEEFVLGKPPAPATAEKFNRWVMIERQIIGTAQPKLSRNALCCATCAKAFIDREENALRAERKVAEAVQEGRAA